MRTNTTKKTFAAGALLVAAVLTLSACGTGDDSTTSVAEVSDTGPQKAATVLDRQFTKPDLVLTDTNGKPYDLRKETEGKPTLIYFGYTNCPDVCPLTMNNLAVAKKEVAKKVSKSELANLRLVFVTTDPERDTAAELGKWLKGIDSEIVGLTGDFADIQAGAFKLGISINPPTKDENGKTISEHGTQVIAFSPKTDGGYVLYNDKATVQDYEKDLPKLLKGENP
ncbi:SCO family protein [Streptomyces europaeiscabiei]|uniref:SCO family protein n=1 Tax=Streptomyces europaeiscabiei TaxID=146819 RepID=A0ABU4NH83_9ACTN|nr:SCO family protein [Streptomyces europaeiscabiei]MDX2527829.1 SCO family protein [Streptomyces europaeiscabiei]MDX2757457.1 SCO family protein [Streptomyces europaeiscabiei]MDX3544905.1 SCO family protein [Streptomyces europaeiscabiei]MDX3554593.1 SCO family protein [Streptomyces europaeiscabiei]MDX3670504.1 SCO family protein [Streptomyces europaeiscabiei]